MEDTIGTLNTLHNRITTTNKEIKKVSGENDELRLELQNLHEKHNLLVEKHGNILRECIASNSLREAEQLRLDEVQHSLSEINGKSNQVMQKMKTARLENIISRVSVAARLHKAVSHFATRLIEADHTMSSLPSQIVPNSSFDQALNILHDLLPVNSQITSAKGESEEMEMENLKRIADSLEEKINALKMFKAEKEREFVEEVNQENLMLTAVQDATQLEGVVEGILISDRLKLEELDREVAEWTNYVIGANEEIMELNAFLDQIEEDISKIHQGYHDGSITCSDCGGALVSQREGDEIQRETCTFCLRTEGAQLLFEETEETVTVN
eukprot:GDKJ01034498.1.p1 GENE.GDKJ01034498.1~~GDKJ01034498.1.p1  ORF type:complete len:327 (+),score=79.11 GDKJ01034498.1:40-1020(+)